jgi:uncharacterized membrane protein
MIMSQTSAPSSEADSPLEQVSGTGGGPADPSNAGSTKINVGSGERLVSALVGGALALRGLDRGGLRGAVTTLVGAGLVYRAVSGHCRTYSALGINTADRGPAEPQEYFERGIHIEMSVTVSKDPAELYEFWRQFENLPRFMGHLERVTVIDNRKSHWVARGPIGINIEWDAEIINDELGSLIAWRSLGGASVPNAGSVRFVPAPHDRGTEVKVVLDYIPPAGKLGAVFARWLNPGTSAFVHEDLRRFKQIMETGETPTIEGQPGGTHD